MTYDWKSLYKVLDAKRRTLPWDDGISWRRVAIWAKVSPSTFTRMKSGRPISLLSLMKVLQALGLTSGILSHFAGRR